MIAGRPAPDVLVIGAGVIGACCALHLARRGARVTVVERDEVCSRYGSTYGNAGMVVPSDVFPLAAPGVLGRGLRWMLDSGSPFWVRPRPDAELVRWLWLFRSACSDERVRQGMPALRALHTAGSTEFDQFATGREGEPMFHRNGWLTLCATQGAYEAAVADERLAQTVGVRSQLLDADEVLARVPQVRGEIAGGVLDLEDGHIDPQQFVRAVAAQAESHGARFLTQTEVLHLRSEGRRVREAVTTRGVLRAGEVVVAAGAWSSLVTVGLGIDVPVQPAKGYSMGVRRPAGFPEFPLYLTESQVCVTPLGETLRMAGTLELSGFDMTVRPNRLRGIVRGAAAFLGPVAEQPPFFIWRGPRPLSPDGLPFIGRSPLHDNLIVATGHCMLGLSLGPGTGRVVTALALGEAPPVPAEPFRLGRFAARSASSRRPTGG